MISDFLPIIGGLGVAGFGYLGVRLGRRGDRENALIDQLQEDNAELRKRLDGVEAQVHDLQQQIIRLLSRDAQWDIHCGRLEEQVTSLGGEPHPRPSVLCKED